VNIAFLVAFLALPAIAYWRMRSVSWLVIAVAGTFGVFGAVINFAHDRGHFFTQIQLQWVLLIALTLVVVVSLIWPLRVSGFDRMSFRRQLLTIWLPVLLLILVFFYITTFMTGEPGFLRPVGYLIGHGEAEDNAKWLDFTAQWASGTPISQGVPLGGPLQLALTFIATIMAVVSEFTFGGVNQVAVAANTVVYGQFFMAAFAPFILAPMAEARFNGRRIPSPYIWLGALVTAAAALVVINHGHLTLQFTFLMVGLWSAVFLAGLNVPRARLIASLAAAASLTVWLPLNGVAVVILLGWFIYLIRDLARRGFRHFDWISFALWSVVTIGIFQPIVSSLNYVFGTNYLISLPQTVGFSAGTVSASAGGPHFSVQSGLADSGLFLASGGTEQAGPILVLVAVVSVIGAGVYLAQIKSKIVTALYRRFIPLGVMASFALAIYLLDFWVTGSGPNYGSQKFTFLVVIVALTTTLPIALMLLDPSAKSRMSALRWIGVGSVLMLLTVDSILPRAVANVRPENWSPPIPFENTSGSYWWPAEVNGTADQPIATNPVACVYLPSGAIAPTAIVPSGLSDPQRVYACTRQLAGLSGSDTSAQPMVDWLRREWFTNTPAWSDVYEGLANMAPEVLAKPVILLDEGSNVIGLESIQSLLDRYRPEGAG